MALNPSITSISPSPRTAGHLIRELPVGVLKWDNVSCASWRVSPLGRKRGPSWDSPELGVGRHWGSSSFFSRKQRKPFKVQLPTGRAPGVPGEMPLATAVMGNGRQVS